MAAVGARPPGLASPPNHYYLRGAFAVLASQFGHRTADLVAAVTNPVYEPGLEDHQQYREHVTASLHASPWARVVKVSDFTDYAGVWIMPSAGLTTLVVRVSVRKVSA